MSCFEYYTVGGTGPLAVVVFAVVVVFAAAAAEAAFVAGYSFRVASVADLTPLVAFVGICSACLSSADRLYALAAGWDHSADPGWNHSGGPLEVEVGRAVQETVLVNFEDHLETELGGFAGHLAAP